MFSLKKNGAGVRVHTVRRRRILESGILWFGYLHLFILQVSIRHMSIGLVLLFESNWSRFKDVLLGHNFVRHEVPRENDKVILAFGASIVLRRALCCCKKCFWGLVLCISFWWQDYCCNVFV